MVSAIEKLRANAFEVRDKEAEVPRVQKGTFVKVGRRDERFWCHVLYERSDGSFVAVVDNELVRSSWKRGHRIVLQQMHVLETAEASDQLTLRGLVAAWGSVAEAAMTWREDREARGACVKTRPRTWFVLP